MNNNEPNEKKGTDLIRPGERSDDLQIKGRRIIQSPGRFCFGMDAVLLSAFAHVRTGERALDLGTGTGILPILLEAKYDGSSYTGLEIQEESAEIITGITRLPGLIMEGMFTHFAKADETDKTFTNKQYEGYLWMKKRLEENGVTFQYYHCCNSAGIIDVKEANLDLVRAGISTYGLYPSEEVEKENVPLKPALELVSHVAHVKWVDEGTPVSYGGTYITKRRTRIATIPVGYGDGYPRSLSNKGYVLIHG